jgi:hypothetical protein
VIDTGIGIAKKDFGKIFKRFSQVESHLTRKVGGSGLGLSICKAMVEAMDGKIWFESQLGKGSTFSFLLPIKISGKPKEEKNIRLFKSLKERGFEPTDRKKIERMIEKGFITRGGRIKEGITPQELEMLGYIKIDYEKIIRILIDKLEKIIGPMAVEAAKSIDGIEISKDNKVVIKGEKKKVLHDLIANYENFLGPLGRVLAREEISQTLSKMEFKE